jgi:phosphomannomutase
LSELKNLMISVSGVRGIVGDGLTPEVALQFAQAYGSEFGPGRIVVGRDSRVTGEMIKYAIWAGLASVGCDVLDIGIAPTPTTEMATEHKENAGGIIITASHNPKEWNALKLLAPDGLFLDAEQGATLLQRVQQSDFTFASWDKVGKIVSCASAIDHHLQTIKDLPIFNIPSIHKRRFKIVADCCNGAGGTILPQLFDALGCEVVFLNEEASGLFPRNPEPVPANLGQLCAAVLEHSADLGIAVDPDVDRLALVSDQGRPLGEEYTLALATDFVLSKTPGDVVINASTSRVIDDLAAKYGSKVLRTKVGEIHVAKRAREVRAVMAGEGNGGVIYPALHLGRDAIVGIAMVLQYLAEKNCSLSQAFSSLPQYAMIKDKIQLPFDAEASAIVSRMFAKHSDDQVDDTDGIKFLYPDSWVHIRASNTEPIIRIIAEAPSSADAEGLVSRFKKEISALAI